MRSLLDVNVLIALLDSKHDFHDQAHCWRAKDDNSEWASCPLTQNGVLRIMSNPSYYSIGSLSLNVVAGLLRDLTASSDHEFWADDVSILDTTRFDLGEVLGSRQLTDLYLVALAVKNGGRLVSFDTRINLSAVSTAKSENLLLI